MGLEIFDKGSADEVNDGTAYYSELARGAAQDYDSENGFANRTFYVLWENADTFVDALLGYSSAPGGNRLQRTLPDNHPDYETLWAATATLEGKGQQSDGPNGAIEYDYAEIQATYRSMDYALLDDDEIGTSAGSELQRYCSRGYVFTSQYLSTQGYMYWVTRNGTTTITTPNGPQMPPKVLNNPPGKIVTNVQKTITWHQVPAATADPFDVPNITTILSCLGTVNTRNFDGHVAGSVLFLGVDPKIVKPRIDSDQWYWELTYQFQVINNGFSLVMGVNGATATDTDDLCAGNNYIYDTLFGRWDLVTSDGTVNGHRIYSYSDHNMLFVLS